MAYAVVQSQGQQSTTNATAASLPSSTTTGNLLVVVAWTNFTSFAAVNSITDNKGNTFTNRGSIIISNGTMYLFTAQNITGGASHVVTANMSGTGQENGLYVREYSGIASSAFDKYAGQAQNTTAPTSPATATLASQPQLVVGIEAVSLTTAGLSAGAGFGNFTTFTGSNWIAAFEDKRVTTTAAVSANFGQASAWNSGNMVVTFAEGGGGGGTTGPKTLALMGIGI